MASTTDVKIELPSYDSVGSLTSEGSIHLDNKFDYIEEKWKTYDPNSPNKDKWIDAEIRPLSYGRKEMNVKQLNKWVEIPPYSPDYKAHITELLLHRIYSGTHIWQIENTSWIKLIFVLIILLIVGLGVYIYWKETEQKKEPELIKKELELIKKELDKKLNNFGI